MGKTIKDVLKNKLNYRVDAVGKEMHKVIINGNVFTDYKAFSFLWEKSYIKSPTRSSNGEIGNLNSYATFLTPHLKIDFSLMTIDDYRTLMNLIYSANEFIVSCYDIVNDKRTTNRMYFTTEEMPKLWTIVEALNGNDNALMLLGVQDYTVEMVGTNAPMDEIDVLYYDNNGNLIPNSSQQVIIGTEFIVNYNFIAPSGYRFEGEWKDEQGTIYRNGDVVKVNQYNKDNMSFKLYAEVVPTDEYTLSFAYGNGNVLYSQVGGAVNSIKIKENETINQAIARANITLNNGATLTFPENGTGGLSVEYEENGQKKYKVPYRFKGWYWTTEANDETRVYGSTNFGYKLNRTIYQIYEPIKYLVIYETNTNAVNITQARFAYKTSVSLPTLSIQDYTFIGWYTDSEFTKQFSGTMPPYDITLYAKWEKNK